LITRNELDIDYIIQSLLTGKSYSDIANRETTRLSTEKDVIVSRSMIAGIHRDLKEGTLRPSQQKRIDDKYIPTYVWGVEPDNGGLPLFIGHPQIDGDAVVISDVHAPFTDYEFAEKPNEVGEHYGVKRLIIAGDLLDSGTQNKFRKKVRPPTFSTDLEMGRKLLAYWSEWFDEMWFLPGNHDDWFLENEDGDINIQDIYHLLRGDSLRGMFIDTPYARVTLNSSGEVWTIPHQAENNVTSLVTGEKLVNKYRTNVIVPHQHNHAWGYDRYGHNVIVDIGGLHDENKMAYMTLKTSTRPKFDKSFAVIIDGGFDVITPDARHLASRKFI